MEGAVIQGKHLIQALNMVSTVPLNGITFVCDYYNQMMT